MILADWLMHIQTPTREGVYHLSDDNWQSWWEVNVLYKKGTKKLFIRAPETGKLTNVLGLQGWEWRYLGPPICQKCHNNRQVWINQISNHWRCHRITCELDIEL